MIQGIRDVAAVLVTGVALAACSSAATSPFPNTVVNPLNGTLQVAVGTANIYGDSLTLHQVGTNVVETFRQIQGMQAPGDTAALVTVPTLSGPFTLGGTAGAPAPDGSGATIETGPAPVDIGSNHMTSSAQPNPGNPNVATTTFGAVTNASGEGLEPYNYTAINNPGGGGSPWSIVPYSVPLFDSANLSSSAPDLNSFTPWGGPPAYDPNHDGRGVLDGKPIPGGLSGVALGLNFFENLPPGRGGYTISVLVPAHPGGGTKAASAGMNSPTTVLPAFTTPTAVVPDGSGGATVTATLPPGVLEALVQIVDIGPDNATPSSASCNGAVGGPIYYTVLFKTPGTSSQHLSNAHGPVLGGVGTHTLCTAADNTAANGGTAEDGDSFTIQTIGFDYTWYEASYPQSSGNAAPPITGASGQSDITVSTQVACSQPKGTLTCAPVLRVRGAMRAALIRSLHPSTFGRGFRSNLKPR